jgi:8-oxo-dGTP pyrophosphatase MutT (NUDIX family)
MIRRLNVSPRMSQAVNHAGVVGRGRSRGVRIPWIAPSSAAALWIAVSRVSCYTRAQQRKIPRRRQAIPRKPPKRSSRSAVRIQYAALPYRFTPDAALEILLVTTRQSRRWIIPKGWPIKGLRPPKSAAREAFEEAGVRGRIGSKAVGLFDYDKLLEDGIPVSCEVKVFPLLVKRQSEVWPEVEQRLTQWVEPSKAVSLIKEPALKKLVAAFAKRHAAAARKSTA